MDEVQKGQGSARTFFKKEMTRSVVVRDFFISLFLLLAVSSVTRASVSVKAFECPTEFEGSVEKIEELDSADHALAKVKITFKNERALKGADFNEASVKILKYGMLQPEKGSLYSIALRGDKVCDIRAI